MYPIFCLIFLFDLKKITVNFTKISIKFNSTQHPGTKIIPTSRYRSGIKNFFFLNSWSGSVFIILIPPSGVGLIKRLKPCDLSATCSDPGYKLPAAVFWKARFTQLVIRPRRKGTGTLEEKCWRVNESMNFLKPHPLCLLMRFLRCVSHSRSVCTEGPLETGVALCCTSNSSSQSYSLRLTRSQNKISSLP